SVYFLLDPAPSETCTLSLHDALPILQEEFARRGLRYGPAFQGLQEAWVGDGEVLGRVEAPETEGFLLHPAALDACLQATLLLLPDRKSTRLNSSHVKISYAVFCLKKK